MKFNRMWTIVALLSGGALALLAVVQYYAPDLARLIDIPISSLVVPFQTYTIVQAFLAVTALGDVAGIIAIALGAAFFMRSNPRYIVLLSIALAGSTVSANALKVFISRMRPETLLWLNPFLSFSFPSGHATASMTLFGFVGLASSRLIAPGAKRTLAIAACILAILLVGASRIVLGAHFFSDVVGGWLLGLFWVSLVGMYKRW